MLPDIHTDSFQGKSNETGMSGLITNRNIKFLDNYGGDYRVIHGILNGVFVIETHSVDIFGGSSNLETLEQWEAKTKEFDKVCSTLV